MPLKFTCRYCKSDIIVKYLKVGETAQCKSCGCENVVPEAAIETAQPPCYSKSGAVENREPLSKIEIDGEDFYDCFLSVIQDSFKVVFCESEIKGIYENKEGIKISDFVSLVSSKLEGRVLSDDCSTVRVFCEVRSWIAKTFQIDKREVRLNTKLSDIFPKGRRNRKMHWGEFGKYIGYKIPNLVAPEWLEVLLGTLWVLSFPIMIWNGAYGLSLLAFSNVFLYFANKYGASFYLNNIKDLLRYIVRHNYYKTKKEQGAYNKLEVERVILDYFADYLSIDDRKNVDPDMTVVLL